MLDGQSNLVDYIMKNCRGLSVYTALVITTGEQSCIGGTSGYHEEVYVDELWFVYGWRDMYSSLFWCSHRMVYSVRARFI